MASADNAAAQANSSTAALIDFILRRHPQETLVDSLKREYVRTSQEMTVENLKVYLGKKLSYSQYSHFQVSSFRLLGSMIAIKTHNSHIFIDFNNCWRKGGCLAR